MEKHILNALCGDRWASPMYKSTDCPPDITEKENAGEWHEEKRDSIILWWNSTDYFIHLK